MPEMKHNVNTVLDLEHWLAIDKHTPTLLMFYATWHSPSIQLIQVFHELSRTYPHIQHILIEAEALPELSMQYEIESVPTFIMLINALNIHKFEGTNVPQLTAMVKKYHTNSEINLVINAPEPSPVDNLNKRIAALIASQPMMIFIKGTPQDPECGFSRKLVDLLNESKCQYGSFNILADENIREEMKIYSNWPTFPQLYINSEFIGKYL
jgi:Grx4 family monothiol glutaredoxin